jgi:hypothetical protein
MSGAPRSAVVEPPAEMLVLALVLTLSNVVGGPVEPWRPPEVSSPEFESHAAFDPRNDDLYFVRSAPDFSGWRIVVSPCGPDGREPARPAVFSAPGLEADPYFAPDGDLLYYISTRANRGASSRDLDIWRVARSADGGWEAPERLPEPVNSDSAEWFPRLATDGWLYFGSARAGGHGGNDIWRARARPDGEWRVENAGPGVNGPGEEYEPAVSPDGAAMIVATSSGLFESRRDGDGWAARTPFGPEINVNGSEVGPLFSPSGRSVLFSRDTRGALSGEFFLWRRGGEEVWPPDCPSRR